jgi:preprotein translocase subunit SecY
MSRAVIILIVILVIVVGAVVFLSSRTREVPTQPVEIDVTNAAGH